MFTYRTLHVCSLVLAVLLHLACTRAKTDPAATTNNSNSPTPDEQALVIRATESPASGDSREPGLNATSDGRIILSWVENVGDKRYALRTATRDQSGWSKPQTVAQGDNWFVNWADFP